MYRPRNPTVVPDEILDHQETIQLAVKEANLRLSHCTRLTPGMGRCSVFLV